MLAKRIIPCLDIRDGRVVKGVAFKNLRDAGDPVERAEAYMATGADELCFLDVTASIDKHPLLVDLIRKLSKVLFIPFTVGGGVRSVDDAKALLRAGADKIGVNTAAVIRPDLIAELAAQFGNQCVVLSIDALGQGADAKVTTHGGREVTDRSVCDWAREAVELGAGEILLNSVDSDGVRGGFACELVERVVDAVSVPVIASGGAGDAADFVELFSKTRAHAGLAASIFHDGSTTPNDVKKVLRGEGIEVRL
ncbi:MAG: imidazole glycerol phosphate synthase subunit HisF [Phycisphaerae bacterium]|nr:MAG: imidazole glycerol phosphate synthase subunit HisF [Phycisphaerae bacterium]